MKILLANPPWDIGSTRAGSRWAHRDEGKSPNYLDRIISYLDKPKKTRFRKAYRVFPLFLGQAASVLERSGFGVRVIDSIARDQREEDFLKEAVTFKPDISVFETSTPSFKRDLEIIKKVKEETNSIIVMCGSHVSALPEEALDHKFVDYVAIGEYELIIDSLAKRLQNKEPIENVLGIAYRKGGSIKINPRQPLIENLDELPLPAYHLMPMEKYWTPYSKTDTSMEIMSTRGCPYQCTYCIFPQIFYNSPRVRFRSPEKVLDEIGLLLTKYKKQGIYFNDDTLTLRKSYVMDICSEIKKRGLKFPWGCFGRVDTVDREMLQAMKEAGCIMIKYGVESGSQKILDNVKKGYTLEKVREAFRLTKEIGIGTHATLMIGLPGETKETIKETLEFVKSINPDTTVWALLTPFPGTKLYQESVKNNSIEVYDWDKYDGGRYAIMRTEEMSTKDIERAWEHIKNEWALYRQRRKSQIKNFLKGTYREKGVAGIPARTTARTIQIIRQIRNSKINRPKSA